MTVTFGSDCHLFAKSGTCVIKLRLRRHVVYRHGIRDLTSEDYIELFQESLHLYPNKRLTLDHVPASIRFLQTYDQGHSTKHTGKAVNLFIQFAEAIVKTDKKDDHGEAMLLVNFKDILNAL